MRSLLIAGLGMMLALVVPMRATATLGPDAASCAAGGRGPALLVKISGFKDRAGLLRVSTYPATEADWLVKGHYTKRIDVPMPATGEVEVCVALPSPGHYGVAVLHDRNGDHRANIFRDGGGFSNNPSLGLSKPGVDKVAFAAGPGLTTVGIQMKYL